MALAVAYIDQPFVHALKQFVLYLYTFAVTQLLFVPIMFGRKGAPDSAVRQVNAVRLLIARGWIYSRGKLSLFGGRL